MEHFIYEKKETILKVTDLNLSYGDKQILNNINLHIENITRPGIQQGQIVSLLGRSGIGKSQFFNMLAGLKTPTSGTILIGTDQHPVKAGDMGVVPQNYILFNHLTVKKNLEISASKNPKIKSKAQIKETIENYSNQFQLTEHLDKYPNQLSGGQRQRACIIRQLINGCDFILLDEPFSGLDVLVLEKVIDTLIAISLTDELKTLIIVSHDLEHTVAISDTVFVLGRQDGANGAVIRQEIDLIERGLAWQKDIQFTPEFKDTIKEIKNLL